MRRFVRRVNIAVASLLIAVFVAALLAQLLLRPIHVIRSGLTRLGKGEFGVTLDLPPGDEFGELGTFFNTVSQQLSADRSLLAGQKANLQSAVEHLEDAVALFNPSGELLFSNPGDAADASGRCDWARASRVAAEWRIRTERSWKRRWRRERSRGPCSSRARTQNPWPIPDRGSWMPDPGPRNPRLTTFC